MKASRDRDLGMMLKFKSVVKGVLEFLLGYPIFVVRKIP